MKRFLIISLIFILSSFIACKDEEFNASLLKNHLFEEYNYPNFPDLSVVDTIKYCFTEDTLIAIGDIYKAVDENNMALCRDTQRYYFKIHESNLILSNFVQPDPPTTISPNWIGLTRYTEWRITKIKNNVFDLEFIYNGNGFAGNAKIWKIQ